MVGEVLSKLTTLLFTKRCQGGVMHAMVIGGKVVESLPGSVLEVEALEGLCWIDLSMANTMNDRSHLETNVSLGMV